jgi:sec-independent protein translocase protein TatB
LRSEIGPEIEELRRQVADLQSLKEIQGLRELRDLSPKRLLTKSLLGEEFSGGVGGFLGLNAPPAAVSEPGAATGHALATDATSAGTGTEMTSRPADAGTPTAELITVGSGPIDVEAHRAMLTKSFSAMAPQVPVATAPAAALVTAGAPEDRETSLLLPGDKAPFDIDGT